MNVISFCILTASLTKLLSTILPRHPCSKSLLYHYLFILLCESRLPLTLYDSMPSIGELTSDSLEAITEVITELSKQHSSEASKHQNQDPLDPQILSHSGLWYGML